MKITLEYSVPEGAACKYQTDLTAEEAVDYN